MSNLYFHDLPVSRLTSEAYYVEQDKKIAAFIATEMIPQRHVKTLTRDLQQHANEKYGPWEFNEIIGYIRLHFLGSQIRGEYYGVEKRRYVRSRQKTMLYHTRKLAPERHLRPHATNQEIFQVILQYVEDCRRELPRRYVDDENLRRVGPFIDWNALRISVQSR